MTLKAVEKIGKARQKAALRALPKGIWGYIIISPWLIGFFALTLWPMLESLYLSFTHYDLLTSPSWIGTQNITSVKVTFL